MKCTNLVEFALVFAAEARVASRDPMIDKPEQIAIRIGQLRKLAVQLESLNLAACNTGLTDRQEKRKNTTQNDLKAICAEYGIGAVTQGDPRGAAFGILCKHTGKYNSLGGLESGFRMMFEGK